MNQLTILTTKHVQLWHSFKKYWIYHLNQQICKLSNDYTRASTVSYVTCYLEVPTKEVMLNQHIHSVCFQNSGFLKQHKVTNFSTLNTSSSNSETCILLFCMWML